MASPAPTERDCVVGNTIPNKTADESCNCYPPYHGERCENQFAHWVPMSYFHTLFGMLMMCIAIYWSILKFVRLARIGKLRFKQLSVIALSLNLIGTLLRLTYLAWTIPTFDDFDTPLYVSIVSIVLVVLPNVAWIMANSLIVGFWFDILYAKLRPQSAKVTRVVCYVGASLALLAIPGLILWLRFGLPTIGLPLTLFPLVVNTIGIAVITIVVACLAKKKVNGKLQDHNIAKIRYVIRVFSLLSVAWALYTIVTIVGFMVQVGAPLLFSYIGLALWFIHRCCEAVIAFSLLFLIDRGGGLRRLTRYCCCGVDFDDTGKVSSTALGSSSSRFSSTNGPNSVKESTKASIDSSERATVEAPAPRLDQCRETSSVESTSASSKSNSVATSTGTPNSGSSSCTSTMSMS